MALAYQKIVLYGDSLTDYVWVHNVTDTQATINSTLSNTFVPTWDSNTLLLAPFTTNINGGKSTDFTGEILNWWVYKKTINDSILSLVAVIPATQNSLIDYNVLNNTDYQYTVFAETSDYLSTPMQSSVVTTSWWNWSLIGMKPSDTSNLYYADTDNIWLFDTNLTSDALTQNLATYTVENFTQYPKVAQGKRNYVSGGLECLINNYDVSTGKYTDTITMQNTFREFINNGEMKLLRDRKGNAFIVQTIANEFNYVDDSNEQITKIKFSFIQIDDHNNVRIIGA
jgi:hypothetical protein